jgi:hypothetical protein
MLGAAGACTGSPLGFGSSKVAPQVGSAVRAQLS